jgi:hypothetical protein
MKTYLIFFGSSDGFTYEAYDIETGEKDIFKKSFREFNQLDPTVLTTDKLENLPVYGKYKTINEGVSISILKIYQCAQSFVSSRFGGSNIGVAIVSEKDLAFNYQNFSLLKSIHDRFISKALSNGKFMDRSIVSFSDKTFDENKGLLAQIIYNPNPLNNSSLNGNAVFITKNTDNLNLEKINSISSSEKFMRYYICSDQNFVEKCLTTKTFVYYLERNNQFISNKKLQEEKEQREREQKQREQREREQKQREQRDREQREQREREQREQREREQRDREQKAEASRNTGGFTNTTKEPTNEIFELNNRINKANDFINKQDKKIKRFKIILILTLASILIYYIATIFSSEANPNKQEKKYTEKSLDSLKKIHNEEIKKLEGSLKTKKPDETNKLKDLFKNKDTSSIVLLIKFLEPYKKECRKKSGKPDSVLNSPKHKEITKKLNLK